MEGALVAHEVLHSIHSNNVSSFVVKMDMMKAYDKLNWFFLFKVFCKFGFAEKWCKWIRVCISEAHFSVLINGSSIGFFVVS